MINALTIDVEDYYNVFARDRLGLSGVPTDAVVRNVYLMLELLAGRNIEATFFVLGEVAVQFPKIIKDISSAGHELGVHGYHHDQVFRLSRDEFSQQAHRTKQVLQDLTGSEVNGYRAPAFSICPDTKWALEVLAELGFAYDSSIFPIAGSRYGWPGFRRDIHRMALPGGMHIVEAPASSVDLLGRSMPACGGGYLRHFPYWFTRWSMRRIERRRPVVVYAHPYELDTDSPPTEFTAALARADRRTKRFHKLQLRKRQTVRAKLDNLLGEFRFMPLGRVIAGQLEDGCMDPQGGNGECRC